MANTTHIARCDSTVIWAGTSVEDQARADERIPHLLRTLAAVRFLLCEPLLGPIDFRISANGYDKHGYRNPFLNPPLQGIDWVIVGGESGPNARPCNVEWIRSIKDQCAAAGVPVFVKQLGSKPVCDCSVSVGSLSANCAQHFPLCIRHPKGGDPAEWPEDLRVQQFPK